MSHKAKKMSVAPSSLSEAAPKLVAPARVDVDAALQRFAPFIAVVDSDTRDNVELRNTLALIQRDPSIGQDVFLLEKNEVLHWAASLTDPDHAAWLQDFRTQLPALLEGALGADSTAFVVQAIKLRILSLAGDREDRRLQDVEDAENHRQELIEQFLDDGMTEKQAEKQADAEIKTEAEAAAAMDADDEEELAPGEVREPPRQKAIVLLRGFPVLPDHVTALHAAGTPIDAVVNIDCQGRFGRREETPALDTKSKGARKPDPSRKTDAKKGKAKGDPDPTPVPQESLLSLIRKECAKLPPHESHPVLSVAGWVYNIPVSGGGAVGVAGGIGMAGSGYAATPGAMLSARTPALDDGPVTTEPLESEAEVAEVLARRIEKLEHHLITYRQWAAKRSICVVPAVPIGPPPAEEKHDPPPPSAPRKSIDATAPPAKTRGKSKAPKQEEPQATEPAPPPPPPKYPTTAAAVHAELGGYKAASSAGAVSDVGGVLDLLTSQAAVNRHAAWVKENGVSPRDGQDKDPAKSDQSLKRPSISHDQVHVGRSFRGNAPTGTAAGQKGGAAAAAAADSAAAQGTDAAGHPVVSPAVAATERDRIRQAAVRDVGDYVDLMLAELDGTEAIVADKIRERRVREAFTNALPASARNAGSTLPASMTAVPNVPNTHQHSAACADSHGSCDGASLLSKQLKHCKVVPAVGVDTSAEEAKASVPKKARFADDVEPDQFNSTQPQSKCGDNDGDHPGESDCIADLLATFGDARSLASKALVHNPTAVSMGADFTTCAAIVQHRLRGRVLTATELAERLKVLTADAAPQDVTVVPCPKSTGSAAGSPEASAASIANAVASDDAPLAIVVAKPQTAAQPPPPPPGSAAAVIAAGGQAVPRGQSRRVVPTSITSQQALQVTAARRRRRETWRVFHGHVPFPEFLAWAELCAAEKESFYPPPRDSDEEDSDDDIAELDEEEEEDEDTEEEYDEDGEVIDKPRRKRVPPVYPPTYVNPSHEVTAMERRRAAWQLLQRRLAPESAPDGTSREPEQLLLAANHSASKIHEEALTMVTDDGSVITASRLRANTDALTTTVALPAGGSVALHSLAPATVGTSVPIPASLQKTGSMIPPIDTTGGAGTPHSLQPPAGTPTRKLSSAGGHLSPQQAPPMSPTSLAANPNLSGASATQNQNQNAASAIPTLKAGAGSGAASAGGSVASGLSAVIHLDGPDGASASLLAKCQCPMAPGLGGRNASHATMAGSAAGGTARPSFSATPASMTPMAGSTRKADASHLSVPGATPSVTPTAAGSATATIEIPTASSAASHDGQADVPQPTTELWLTSGDVVASIDPETAHVTFRRPQLDASTVIFEAYDKTAKAVIPVRFSEESRTVLPNGTVVLRMNVLDDAGVPNAVASDAAEALIKHPEVGQGIAAAQAAIDATVSQGFAGPNGAPLPVTSPTPNPGGNAAAPANATAGSAATPALSGTQGSMGASQPAGAMAGLTAPSPDPLLAPGSVGAPAVTTTPEESAAAARTVALAAVLGHRPVGVGARVVLSPTGSVAVYRHGWCVLTAPDGSRKMRKAGPKDGRSASATGTVPSLQSLTPVPLATVMDAAALCRVNTRADGVVSVLYDDGRRMVQFTDGTRLWTTGTGAVEVESMDEHTPVVRCGGVGSTDDSQQVALELKSVSATVFVDSAHRSVTVKQPRSGIVTVVDAAARIVHVAPPTFTDAAGVPLAELSCDGAIRAAFADSQPMDSANDTEEIAPPRTKIALDFGFGGLRGSDGTISYHVSPLGRTHICPASHDEPVAPTQEPGVKQVIEYFMEPEIISPGFAQAMAHAGVDIELSALHLAPGLPTPPVPTACPALALDRAVPHPRQATGKIAATRSDLTKLVPDATLGDVQSMLENAAGVGATGATSAVSAAKKVGQPKLTRYTEPSIFVRLPPGGSGGAVGGAAAGGKKHSSSSFDATAGPNDAAVAAALTEVRRDESSPSTAAAHSPDPDARGADDDDDFKSPNAPRGIASTSANESTASAKKIDTAAKKAKAAEDEVLYVELCRSSDVATDFARAVAGGDVDLLRSACVPLHYDDDAAEEEDHAAIKAVTLLDAAPLWATARPALPECVTSASRQRIAQDPPTFIDTCHAIAHTPVSTAAASHRVNNAIRTQSAAATGENQVARVQPSHVDPASAQPQQVRRYMTLLDDAAPMPSADAVAHAAPESKARHAAAKSVPTLLRTAHGEADAAAEHNTDAVVGEYKSTIATETDAERKRRLAHPATIPDMRQAITAATEEAMGQYWSGPGRVHVDAVVAENEKYTAAAGYDASKERGTTHLVRRAANVRQHPAPERPTIPAPPKAPVPVERSPARVGRQPLGATSNGRGHLQSTHSNEPYQTECDDVLDAQQQQQSFTAGPAGTLSSAGAAVSKTIFGVGTAKLASTARRPPHLTAPQEVSFGAIVAGFRYQIQFPLSNIGIGPCRTKVSWAAADYPWLKVEYPRVAIAPGASLPCVLTLDGTQPQGEETLEIYAACETGETTTKVSMTVTSADRPASRQRKGVTMLGPAQLKYVPGSTKLARKVAPPEASDSD